ncbi:hypothetical protein GCM10010411_23400 [Actinomadura fulvescens]|uniref:Transposase n=1 Tax=Actinomadura fulvescens TaxID=46160 RepID=A0ABN3PJU1_9ACTN
MEQVGRLEAVHVGQVDIDERDVRETPAGGRHELRAAFHRSGHRDIRLPVKKRDKSASQKMHILRYQYSNHLYSL